MSLISTFIRILASARRRLSPGNKCVHFAGSILPPPALRFCGSQLKDNQSYIESAEKEANRLVSFFDCTSNTRILDVGCGQGRLPIGILRVIGNLSYTGLDVDVKSIAWCKRYIEANHPLFKFQHINIGNERYNKRGTPLDMDFKFDVPDKSVDIIYLFSVFSHMKQEDMLVYLNDFKRILADTGGVFFTTFVEEDVPDVSINPENYQFARCSGPLHIVRYDKKYLFSMLEQMGFFVKGFTHRTEIDGQSAIYLGKNINRK